MENLSMAVSSDQNLNPGPLEHKVGVLTTLQWYSFLIALELNFFFFQMIRRTLILLKQMMLLKRREHIVRTLKPKLGTGSRKEGVSWSEEKTALLHFWSKASASSIDSWNRSLLTRLSLIHIINGVQNETQMYGKEFYTINTRFCHQRFRALLSLTFISCAIAISWHSSYSPPT